jgi:hypothetical protein
MFSRNAVFREYFLQFLNAFRLLPGVNVMLLFPQFSRVFLVQILLLFFPNLLNQFLPYRLFDILLLILRKLMVAPSLIAGPPFLVGYPWRGSCKGQFAPS